jgi:glucosamine-6-phosphate deaminase
MGIENFSNVKRVFYEESGSERFSTKIPYILVDNFPKPGKFVALRFLE